MIMSTDISAKWDENDIALFAATVGTVQQAIKELVIKYGRQNDAILDIVVRGGLTGIKGLMLEVGLRDDKSSIPAFNAWAEMLTREVEQLPSQCRAFESSMIVHGRA